MLLLEDRRFYCYVYLDPRKPGTYSYKINNKVVCFGFEPFYVGKGIHNRMREHLNESKHKKVHSYKVHKIRAIWEDGLEPIILKVEKYLTEKESFELETEFILAIGRIDLKTGSLSNLTNGGEGGSGRILSAFSKSKIGDSRRGKNLEEIHGIEKASELRKVYSKNTTRRNTGNHHSDETKRKISEANLGRPSPIKGKSLLEFYGEDKAREIKEINSKHYENVKNKTYEELYGEEKAKEIKAKLSSSLSEAKTGVKRTDIVTCKYCGKSMIISNHTKWHGEKCFVKTGIKHKFKKMKKRTGYKTCEHCGKTVTSQMYSRWHGDKCKKKDITNE